jgi:hypothetical protein
MKLTDFIPGIPLLDTMKKIQKYTIVTVIKIKDNGRGFELCEMKKLGDWLFDDLKHIRYMVQHQSIDLTLNTGYARPASLHAYIVYDDAATTVELERIKPQLDTLRKLECPEKIQGYELKGTTVNLLPDDVMLKFRANPEVWAAFMDNKDVSDMFSNPINTGILFLVLIVGMFLGWLGGSLLGVIFGQVL